MKLSFVQLSGFAANWARLKLGDRDLRELEAMILDAPDGYPVMRATGGLRKIRFAPSGSGAGKSGGLKPQRRGVRGVPETADGISTVPG